MGQNVASQEISRNTAQVLRSFHGHLERDDEDVCSSSATSEEERAQSEHQSPSFHAQTQTNCNTHHAQDEANGSDEEGGDEEEEDIASVLGYHKPSSPSSHPSPTTGKRLRKKNVPLDVWIAHKKQRKKIASAKWYAKKQIVVKEKEAKKIVKKQTQGKYAALFTPPEENPYSYQYKYTEQDKLELQCKWEHQLNGWPVRNPAIPADKWLEIIELAKECVERMHFDPVQDAQKLSLCKRLCVEELKHEFIRYGGVSVDDVRNRCNTPAKPPDSASSSWAERAKFALTNGWFPAACTTAGLYWIQCLVRGQKHLWPALVRHVYPENRTSTTMLPIHEGHHPEMNTPHQMPTTNACEGVNN